jgi:density-regulated protein DRP1
MLTDVDLKKASKLFSQKFATGSSVSKNVEGKEEIVIQGDVAEDVCDFILEMFPSVCTQFLS